MKQRFLCGAANYFELKIDPGLVRFLWARMRPNRGEAKTSLGVSGQVPLILTRLWARMPCPVQMGAPSVRSTRMRSQP